MKKEKRSYLVKAYLTKDEYETILQWSSRAGLTISTFIQRVCTGYKIDSKTDQQARVELRKVNADLGRLGGLLKFALFENKDLHEARRLLQQIEQIQKEIREKVQEI